MTSGRADPILPEMRYADVKPAWIICRKLQAIPVDDDAALLRLAERGRVRPDDYVVNRQRRSLKSRRSFTTPGCGVSGGSPPCSRGERGRSDHSGSTGSLDPLTPHRRWRAAKPSLERMNEMAQAGESAVETRAGHCGAVEEHAPRRRQPHFQQILVWRAAGEAPKNPRELKRADGDRRCHRRQRMPF